jgi:hypothetical protein
MSTQRYQYSNPVYTYGFVGDYNIFSPMYRSLGGMPIVTYILLGGTTLFLAYVTLIDNEPSVQPSSSNTTFGGKRKTAKKMQKMRKSRKN